MVDFVHAPAPSRVVFGSGSLSRLPDELARIGAARAAVLCSPRRAVELRDARAAWSQGDALSIRTVPDPAIGPHEFETMARELAEAFGGLVAYGGGEIIRIGKAVAANTGLPLVAVPTTYSGAELAPNWYIGTGAETKRGSGEDALPRTVLYDPELTLGVPAPVAAASGMNAMAHAVESLYGPDRTPLIEAAAEEAVRRLVSALPRIRANPSDMKARSEALSGAWLAAAYRAKTSLEHLAAQFVRHQFDLNHAAIHAVLLPYVVAFNASHTADANERLKRVLGADDPALGLFQLNGRLGLKTGLREIGMEEWQLEKTVESLAQQALPNPRPVSRNDLEEILGQAYRGDEPRFTG